MVAVFRSWIRRLFAHQATRYSHNGARLSDQIVFYLDLEDMVDGTGFC